MASTTHAWLPALASALFLLSLYATSRPPTTIPALQLSRPTLCRASSPGPHAAVRGGVAPTQRRGIMLGGLSVLGSLASKAAFAANQRKFPPIDPSPSRCEDAMGGNNIGQANGVSDKELDLRDCNLKKRTLAGKTLSGGLFQGGNFDEVDFTEAVMSKAYAAKASFKNSDFSNSVLDRVVFDGSDLSGAKFTNAVITGASFEDSNLTGATFEDAVIGSQDLKRLCKNPTLPAEVAAELGC